MAHSDDNAVSSHAAAARARPQKLLLANLLPDAISNSRSQSSSASSSSQRSHVQTAGSSSSRTLPKAPVASRWWYWSEQEDRVACGGSNSGDDTEEWASPLEDSEVEEEFFDPGAPSSVSRKATALDMRQQILTCTKCLKELQTENDVMSEQLRQTREAQKALIREAETLRAENKLLHTQSLQKHDALLEAQAEAETEKSRWLHSSVELHKAQVALVSIVEELERRVESRDKELAASEHRRAALEAEIRAQERCLRSRNDVAKPNENGNCDGTKDKKANSKSGT